MAQNDRDPTHPLAGKHIIISGAGLAGLAFARALHLKWRGEAEKPRITIYEKRERTPSTDKEGYSISIRSDWMSGGMQALQQLGLLKETLAASVSGHDDAAGRFRVWDVNWNTILTFKQPKEPPNGLPKFMMRIARSVLRRHLIDGLPEAVTAHWGVHCTSAALLENGRMQVVLSDDSTDECDWLVAADGANSSIRAALRPEDKLNFAGAIQIAATARFPQGLPAIIKHDHGIILGGGGTGLFASPIDEHSAVWSVSMLAKAPRRTRSETEEKDGLLQESREQGKPFAQPFGELLDATDPSTLMVINAIDKPPIDHSELARLPVVFIGDANHAVSPFAGNGANMALMDGVDLATEMAEASEMRSAVSAFDRKSMARSKRTLETSHFTIQVAHATGWRLWLYVMVLRVVNFFVAF